MKKLIIVLAVLLGANGEATAKEWSTPEALRAFGQPGDTVKESTKIPRFKKQKKEIKPAESSNTNDDEVSAQNDPESVDFSSPATTPGSPALSKELNNIYSRVYAAMRAGDFESQLQYLVGEQRASVEKAANSPNEQKTLVKQMLSSMPKNYTIAGCSVDADGKSAILNTKRKIAVYNSSDEKIKEQNVFATINFLRIRNNWKISKIQEQ
jgi:hypothetical protein